MERFLSGTLSYDGNADQFTFNTELYVDGNIVSSNNISLTGQGGSGTGNLFLEMGLQDGQELLKIQKEIQS